MVPRTTGTPAEPQPHRGPLGIVQSLFLRAAQSVAGTSHPQGAVGHHADGPYKTAVALLDPDEIEVLKKVYKDLSLRSSTTMGVDKTTFLEYFTLPGMWGDRLFTMFDTKGTGYIDLVEFLFGIAVCCRGTKAERLLVLFEIFDLNGDGLLQRDELVALLSNLPAKFVATQQQKQRQQSARQLRLTAHQSTGRGHLHLPVSATFHPTAGTKASPAHHGWTSPLSSPRTISSRSSWTSDKEDTPSPRGLMPSESAPDVARMNPLRLDAGSCGGPEDEEFDVEGVVDRILEFSQSGALQMVEFKAWIEQNEFLMSFFLHAFHEEVWGLQGNALSRQHSYQSRGYHHASVPNLRELHHLSDSGEEENSRMTDAEGGLEFGHFYRAKRLFKRHQNIAVARAIPTSTPTVPIVGSPDDPRMSTELRDFIQDSHGMIDVVELRRGEFSLVGREKDLLSCPKCSSPLIMCPRCNTRFPFLRLTLAGEVAVECIPCFKRNGELLKYCWHCGWRFAAVSEMIDRNEPLIEGSLYKIGKHLHQWRSRYFVLMDNLLYYYSKKTDTKPRGVILLSACYVERIPTSLGSPQAGAKRLPGRSGRGTDGHGRFGFTLIHQGSKSGTRELFASSEEGRDDWVQALRASMKQKDFETSYSLQGKIGQGKFSFVYRGLSLDTMEAVAIKVIDKRKASDQERELIRSEMAIMRLVKHPHIVCLKDMLDTKDLLYIVMELVEGGELYDLVSGQTRRALPEIKVNRIIAQLLKTVSYLHKCGIVHRDLKPENILMSSASAHDADIKLADFGLSCLCAPDETLWQPCGTLAYVAPEVLAMRGYNRKVDVWSIGIVMSLLLSGRLPFSLSASRMLLQRYKQGFRSPGDSALPSYDARLENPLFVSKPGRPALADFEGRPWTSVSGSAKDLIRRMLHPLPAGRISVREALEHIWITNPEAVIHEASPPVAPDTPSLSTFCDISSVSASTFTMEAPVLPRGRNEERENQRRAKSAKGRGERRVVISVPEASPSPAIRRDSATKRDRARRPEERGRDEVRFAMFNDESAKMAGCYKRYLQTPPPLPPTPDDIPSRPKG